MVEEVSRAGGAAVIAALRPEALSSIRTLMREYLIALPYVQVGATERETVLNYLFSTDSPSASFAASGFSFHNTAPQMAIFNSRGPTSTTRQLVLKPDITAPGISGAKRARHSGWVPSNLTAMHKSIFACMCGSEMALAGVQYNVCCFLLAGVNIQAAYSPAVPPGNTLYESLSGGRAAISIQPGTI